MAFKKPPMGKRGYDEEDVDAFLDEVEQELIRLLEENASLRDRAQRGGGPSPAASTMVIDSELADLAGQLERLQKARARADEHARSMQAQLEQARAAVPSTPPANPADEERLARVLMMAQRTADEHMRDAQREVDQLIADAQLKAEQITSEAQLKAGTIEGDARRNHTEAINNLQTERAALLDEIERLGQLARGYQEALESHLTHQLEELNSAAP